MDVKWNPIATADQAAIEKRAFQVLAHPLVRATVEEVRKAWPELVKPSAEMLKAFQWAFDEVVYAATIWSLNTDKERPKVITITRLPHRLGNLDIPGSRWGLDNPDTVYRVIPISGDERYVIRGRVAKGHRLTENYFSLWDPVMNSVAVQNGKELVTDADGNFTLKNAPVGKYRLMVWHEQGWVINGPSPDKRGRVIDIKPNGTTNVGKISFVPAKDD